MNKNVYRTGGGSLTQAKRYEMNEQFAESFDTQLDGKWSKSSASDPRAEQVVAESIREVLGATSDVLSDDAAIDYAVNPLKNPYLNDTLELLGHVSGDARAQPCPVHLQKRMTHTGDSQEQRHRTTPGSRPLLRMSHTLLPDYMTPPVFEKNEEARKIYDEVIAEMWDAKNRLVALGVPAEFACYILPNAVTLRFTQSGSLLHFMHKWRLRSCFLAQLEIYNCAVDELMQVRDVHPRLGKYLGPPCLTRYQGGVGHTNPARMKEIMSSDSA